MSFLRALRQRIFCMPLRIIRACRYRVLFECVVMANYYYRVLGVSALASEEEIKRAFRLLALRWHPDRNPDDPLAVERFREALEAYENLIEPFKRGQRDKIRPHTGPGTRSSGRQKRRPEVQRTSPPTLDEILRELFGVDCNRPKQPARNDLRFDLQIPRSAAVKGTHEAIVFQRWVFCQTCLGNGVKVPSSACLECHGRGELEELCSLTVWVPAGSRQGARLRIRGEGDRLSPQMPAGDLVVYLHLVDLEDSAGTATN
jgi:molecular chaperone DnaJ